MNKVCTRCHEPKAIEDFYVKEKTTGRRFSWCKECHCKGTGAYLKENRAKFRDLEREHYAQNVEKERAEGREKSRRRRESNPEQVKAYKSTWYKTPKGKACKARLEARRRYHTLAAPNTLTADEWAQIIEAQNNRCACCESPFSDALKPTRDHIIPVSKGGGLIFENVQALCQPCNSRKSAREIRYR